MTATAAGSEMDLAWRTSSRAIWIGFPGLEIDELALLFLHELATTLLDQRRELESVAHELFGAIPPL